MRIFSVATSRGKVTLPGHQVGPNRIDLLTGPNGSGKTEVLTALATSFRGGRQDTSAKISWQTRGRTVYSSGDDPFAPKRVVAQTFSPFSRFPAPIERESTLTAIYGEGTASQSEYICVGLHKASRLIGSRTSKNSLEQAIYRASEAPESAHAIIEVTRSLGFEPYFELTYQPSIRLQEILSATDQDAALNGLIDNLEGSPIARSALHKELRRTGRSALQELMRESLSIVRHLRKDGLRFSQVFGFHARRQSIDYAALQALSLLRRLNLLTLTSCYLTTKGSVSFDIASASSGQQQMLCSVIGLATALKRESLVLIDEPELSLHPRWQQTYLDTLRATLEPFEGCHALIATHSPLIVQRGLSLGVGVVQVGNTTSHEFGGERPSSVEGALLDVFDTPVSESVYLANEIFSAITDAEAGDEGMRREAVAHLSRLRTLYAGTRDEASIKLLNEATDLLTASDDSDV